MSAVQMKPVAKQEAFVESQLARMRGRIRSLDAGRAVLWFFVVTFGYALFAAGLDRMLDLPAGVRLAGFIVYAVAALFFAGSLLLSLYRRINPYYAARMLEETLPDAKNSVVNWLDLRDEKLPPVILSALGNRAARDLRKADPEQAVNVGPTWILAGVLAGLVLGILILFVSSPRQFMSLMGRAFAPFQEVGIATRTAITLLEPEGGNATVSPNRPLTFRAAIDGRVPAVNQEGAPRLHFRYNQADDFAGVPMEQDRDGNYVATLAADQLLNGGLWYKITANDAETPEYEVRVVPIPQVREFAPTYRYRPYLHIGEQSHRSSPALFTGLKAPRGTEVSLVIHANCPIREGSLRVQWSEGKKEVIELPGQVLSDDPEAIRFPKLQLDRNGFFHVFFVSKQGERNIDRSAHKIEIIPDLTPRVELKKPEKDTYPANGVVRLEGSAHDDFGIKSMALRLQAHDNGALHPLEAKPYRPGKSFKLINGKYPDFLEYKDFITLDKVRTPKGQPFALKKGMAVEFWLEAVDNSDYPEANGNLGKSVAHKIVIDEPEKDAAKTKKEQQQAEQEAKEHQKNQDQDLDRRNKAAKEEEQQANNQKSPEEKAQEKTRKDLDNQAQKLQDQLNKQDPKQDNKDQKNEKGEAKGADGPQSNTKKGENNEAAAKENKGDKGQDKAGEQKDAGKNGDDNKPGQVRDEGRKDDPKDKNGESQAKGPGDKSDGAPKGTADKNEPKSVDKGRDKSAAKQSPEKSTASSKEQGKNESGANPGQAKQENPKDKNDPQAKGNDKQAGKEQPGSQAKDDKAGSGQKSAPDKSEPKNGAGSQAQAKDQGKDQGKGEPQANAKEHGKDSPKGAQGSAKSEDKKDSPSTAKDSPKSGGDKSASAKAGNDSGKGSGDKSQAKQASPDDAKRSAQAKGDPGAEKAGSQPKLDDVKKAADDLNNKADPAAQDKAARDLEKIRQNARDPKVRDAADDALQQANRNPARAKKGNGPGEEHQAQAIPKGEGEKGGQAIKGGQVKGDIPTQQPSTGKGESDKQDTTQSETKGGEKAGDFGGGQRGLAGDHKPQAPDKDAGNRGGNLTLEDMKDLIKKTGPAERKQAGISESDWQKFLKDVQAYEQALQKQRALAKLDKTRGGNTKLKGSGPFQVGSDKNDPLDTLQGSRFLPPPEFRQAHREFTRGTPNANDKKK